MNARTEAELELVRSRFRGLEFRDHDNWARIPRYPVPDGWGVQEGGEPGCESPPAI